MKKTYYLSLGILLSCYAFNTYAEEQYIQDQLDQIKSDIVVIQRQLYRDKNDSTVPTESVSNFQMRLGEYDQMIRDMNGKIENIEFRLKNIEKKIETFDKDIDLRFEQFKKQVTASPAPKAAAKGNKSKAANNAVKKSQISKTSTTVPAKELYENALTNLKNNKLTDAENKLSQFLISYPNDNLAGNAQYWLGEVYYKQQNFAKAAVAFKDGYSKYPQGTKGPDCLLKLGMSMKALGKKEEACTAFVNLPAVFDKVSNDISSKAKKEAEALGCK